MASQGRGNHIEIWRPDARARRTVEQAKRSTDDGRVGTDGDIVNIDLEKRPAIGSRGVIVTNHPLGSAAGAEMLAAGGNAIDAAIAALFALTVVEPMMVGIFGAGMANVRRDDGSHWFINNYACLLYTSPSPRDGLLSRMPSSA